MPKMIVNKRLLQTQRVKLKVTISQPCKGERVDLSFLPVKVDKSYLITSLA